MWPSTPIHIRTLKFENPNECYLVVYTENAVDIFDAYKGVWLQTIPTKKVLPMDANASLSLHTNDLEAKRLCFLTSVPNADDLHLPYQISPSSPRRNLVKQGKRRFVYKSADTERSKSLKSQMQDPNLRTNLISGPQNFRHVTHMGPESGIQMMATEQPTPNRKTSFISGPSNFKHVYHYGPDDATPANTTPEPFQRDRSLLDSRTSLIRSTNSSDMSEKSPTQSDHIEKRYSRRSGYYNDD